MNYVDATHIIQPDTRTPAERWLDNEIERRGAGEQGAEPGVLLRAIALELREQLTANTERSGAERPTGAASSVAHNQERHDE